MIFLRVRTRVFSDLSPKFFDTFVCKDPFVISVICVLKSCPNLL